jgi:hypothetical protein
VIQRELESVAEVSATFDAADRIGALLPHSGRRLSAAILGKADIRAVKRAAVLVPVLVNQVAVLVVADLRGSEG